MAIVDLKTRLSSKRDECEASKMSAESLIYTDSNIDIAEGNPMSIDLKVGDICLLPGDSRTYRIDEHGIVYASYEWYQPFISIEITSDIKTERNSRKHTVWVQLKSKEDYALVLSSGQLDKPQK